MPGRHAYTNPNERGNVSVRIGYPTGPGGKQHAVLTVVDEPSRQTLVEVPLTPDMLMEIMGNGTAHATGATLPVRPDRIGMRAQNISITVPHGKVTDQAVQDAMEELSSDGWLVSTQRTNGGVDVIGRRWLNDDGIPVT